MMIGNCSLKWETILQTRTSNLKSLWENKDFLDVTIACDDDQLYAHKVILSAASPFFRHILQRNQHTHPLLYLKGTTKKDIEAVLEFIYSGETQIAEDEMEKFMELANSLAIEGLVEGFFTMNDDDQTKEESGKITGINVLQKEPDIEDKISRTTSQKRKDNFQIRNNCSENRNKVNEDIPIFIQEPEYLEKIELQQKRNVISTNIHNEYEIEASKFLNLVENTTFNVKPNKENENTNTKRRKSSKEIRAAQPKPKRRSTARNHQNFRERYLTIKKRVDVLQPDHGLDQDFCYIVKNNMQDPHVRGAASTAGKWMVYAKGELFERLLSEGIKYHGKEMVIMANAVDFTQLRPKLGRTDYDPEEVSVEVNNLEQEELSDEEDESFVHRKA